jgi:geranylgeranyl pyrophosphate synthase
MTDSPKEKLLQEAPACDADVPYDIAVAGDYGVTGDVVVTYNAAVARMAEEVRRLLKGAPAVIRKMTAHLAKASGKMIRARALLACAIGRDGVINQDAVKAAAAVELMHLATLIHDDIIDGADKRRGIDALHSKFGEKYAVLCGDWLFCAALDLASTMGTPEHRRDAAHRPFPHYLTEVLLGEVRQNTNNRNYKLSEREYFRIIRGKTAALFEACFYAGFMLSDEADDFLDIYRQIGNNIGLIFQLADDCADYESTREAEKKPILSDYSLGVVTLPLIRALRTDPALSDKIAAGLPPEKLREIIMSAGGLAYTHTKIDGLYKKTRSLIESLDIGEAKRMLLTKLLCKASGKPA